MTLNAETIHQRVMNFMQEAGQYALSKYRQDLDGHQKYNNSLVTEVDLYISNLFSKTFSDIIHDSDHLVVDEETAEDIDIESLEPLHEYETLWSLDPIDGTVPFARSMAMWGISLGIAKRGKPWIGAVYLPALGELYTHNGVTPQFITDPFTDIAKTIELSFQKDRPKGAMPLFFAPAHYINSKKK